MGMAEEFHSIFDKVSDLRGQGLNREQIVAAAARDNWATRDQVRAVYTFQSSGWGLPEEQIYERDIKAEKIKADLSSLKAENKYLRKRADKIDRYLEAFQSVIVPAKPIPIVSREHKGTRQVLVKVSSDEHICAHVAYERLLGINEYDQHIARRRMIYDHQTVAEYINRHWRDKQILHMLDANIGDKFNGTIHGAEATNEMEQAEGMRVWLQTKADCYEYLLKACPNLRITSLHLSGNHTRRTDKQDVNRPLSHDDALSGMALELYFRNEPRVEFIIPNSYFQPLVLEDHLYMFTHGQFVRSWAGIPFYGIIRMYNKMMQIIESTDIFKSLTIDMVRDLLEKHGEDELLTHYKVAQRNWIQGHFHTSCLGLRTEMGKVIMNGSLIGPEEYGLSLALATPPEQVIFAAHPRFGITDATAIQLGHIRHKRELKPLDVLKPIRIAA